MCYYGEPQKRLNFGDIVVDLLPWEPFSHFFADNLKTTGEILTRFDTLVYISWFYDSLWGRVHYSQTGGGAVGTAQICVPMWLSLMYLYLSLYPK